MDYYNSQFYNIPSNQQLAPQQQVPFMNPPVAPSPLSPEANIKAGGFKFTVYKDDHSAPATVTVPDVADPNAPEKRRRGRPRKDETAPAGMVRAGNDNSQIPTMYTYQETTDMLKGTLVQIDQLATQVKGELDNVMSSRTLKSKYSTMVGLSSTLGDIIGQKITAIKEINNAISKSNDMDYKREKDRKAAEAGVNDDKYIMDLYNAFVQAPAGSNLNALGPAGMDATVGGYMPNIIRAGDTPPQQGFNPEGGFLNYVTNMTPEQRLMSVESNPNIKQCVIYDAATGNKAFQWIDMSTGQAVTGLPTRDMMFMEDTTLDIRNKIAKNINLNETYPIVMINENIASEY